MGTERSRDKRRGQSSGICEAEPSDADIALRARVDTLGGVEICTCAAKRASSEPRAFVPRCGFGGFFVQNASSPRCLTAFLATFLCVSNLVRPNNVGLPRQGEPSWLTAGMARWADERRSALRMVSQRSSRETASGRGSTLRLASIVGFRHGWLAVLELTRLSLA